MSKMENFWKPVDGIQAYELLKREQKHQNFITTPTQRIKYVRRHLELCRASYLKPNALMTRL
jgi:hypothetical protein